MFGLSKKTPHNPSKDMAVGRLKMVLTADRVKDADQMLEKMKKDILEVMRRYLVIDEADLDIQICQQSIDGAPESRLRADIPIRNLSRRK